MSERDKRTIRIGAIFLAIYLVAFFGWRGYSKGEGSRNEYQKLQQEAQRLKREIMPYENRVLMTQKMKETFKFDPQKLSRTSLVADASAALQKGATGAGMQVGPVRETAARGSAKELATVQMEGTGPVPGVMSFLSKIETLGFPLIVDSLQVTPDSSKPGSVKVNMTIVILDFEYWKKEEAPRA